MRPEHRQASPLHGRVAGLWACIGLMMACAGALIAWHLRHDDWPVIGGAGLMFVPTITLGLGIASLAAAAQLSRANWLLTAEVGGLSLSVQTERGRVLRHQALAADRMTRVLWIEGDADIAAGLRFDMHKGKGLFIPASHFDCRALALFAMATYPHAAPADLVEQVSAGA